MGSSSHGSRQPYGLQLGRSDYEVIAARAQTRAGENRYQIRNGPIVDSDEETNQRVRAS